MLQGAGLDKVPGLHAPETIVKNLGANYKKADKDWDSYVEVDTSGSGPLVTGKFHLAILLHQILCKNTLVN